MHVSLLEWLRCAFCGTRLTIVEASPLVRHGDDIESGVLGCECCAFPVVAGIPVLVADDTTRDAMHQLEAGHGAQALATLLGLDVDKTRAFEALRASGTMTYRSAIEVLSPDPEGTYFIYRFSDPTYVMAQSVLQVIGAHAGVVRGRALDLCGGSGHLTRVLGELNPADGVVLADVFFWKLWLAKTFTAPFCMPVCCDANNPLPFARETFSLVVLSDAFPYIWQKRMLAEEMMRVAGPSGTIVMPHLHSSLGENFTAGMTLTPASYQELFAPKGARLFSDRALLDDVLGHNVVNLAAAVSAEELGTEPSCTLVATPHADIFSRQVLATPKSVNGELRVNPLYRVTFADGASSLTLSFPTPEYEEEFGECRRYLPETLSLPGDARGPLETGVLEGRVDHLRRTRVVLDVPRLYC